MDAREIRRRATERAVSHRFRIVHDSPDTYVVTDLDDSASGNSYVVRKVGDAYYCPCPSFKHRRTDCKHLAALRVAFQRRGDLDPVTPFEMEATSLG